MKKVIIAFGFVFFGASSLLAQMKEGRITYERKVNNARMFANIDPAIRASLPSEARAAEIRTTEYELLFDEQKSLFRNLPDAITPNEDGGGERAGMRMMRFNQPTNIYTDLEAKMQYEPTSFRDEIFFLIVDSLKPMNWKISDETKTILKYTCKKATTTMATPMGRGFGGPRIMSITNNNSDSSKKATPNFPTTQAAPTVITPAAAPKPLEVTVWYTEEISTSVGPDSFTGLPGAILEVDIDNGRSITTATEVSTKFKKKELVQPTKGKKVNRKEYQQEMMKVFEGMQKNFQGAGGQNIQIRIN